MNHNHNDEAIHSNDRSPTVACKPNSNFQVKFLVILFLFYFVVFEDSSASLLDVYSGEELSKCQQ